MPDDSPSSNDAFFFLPPAGGRLTIYAGVTEFNFYRGEIVHANGTTEAMPFSLKKKHLREVLTYRVDTNYTATCWTDFNMAKRTIEANDSLVMLNMPCKSVFVYVASTATVRVYASNNPAAMVYDSSSVMIASPTATGGKATSLTQTAVSVGTTATLILAANPQRKYFTLQNLGAADVYWAGSATVTTSDGTALITDLIYPDYDYTGAVYGIVAAGANDVRVLEAE
jgi:hypothetical protein